MRRAGFAGIALAFLHVPRQRRAEAFEPGDLLLLAIDDLVQSLDQIFLAGQLDFDVDEAFFGIHAWFPE